MSVRDELRLRGIRELLHFTTNKGLVGILASRELRSRRQLPNDDYLEHILHPNSSMRPEDAGHFDKAEDWLDYVNLSISEINTRFFRSSHGWPHNKDLWWAILSFDPLISCDDNVYFLTTNNSYEHCRRGKDLRGLQALFGEAIRRKNSWSVHRRGRRPHLPTCEQAEVLYPRTVSLTSLRQIYVRTGEQADIVQGWLRDFEYNGIVVKEGQLKFAGAPN